MTIVDWWQWMNTNKLISMNEYQWTNIYGWILCNAHQWMNINEWISMNDCRWMENQCMTTKQASAHSLFLFVGFTRWFYSLFQFAVCVHCVYSLLLFEAHDWISMAEYQWMNINGWISINAHQSLIINKQSPRSNVK